MHYFAYDDPRLLPAAREDDSDDNAENHDDDNDDDVGAPADPQASAGGTKAPLSEFVAHRYYNLPPTKPNEQLVSFEPTNALL